MFNTVLVDGDILVYSIAFSVEVPIYVVKGAVYKTRTIAEKYAKEKNATVHKRINVGSEKDLRRNLNERIKQIKDDCGTSNLQIFITSSNTKSNFRYSVATILPYKGNRYKLIKPIHYDRIRNILINDYQATVVEGQEADDQLAISQTELFSKYANYERSIIASIDKDLWTVPGYHYHLKTRQIDFVDDEQALCNFYRQLLTGDPVDNIPGIVRLLKNNGREEEANNLVHNKYIKHYDDSTIDYNIESKYNYILGLYEGLGFGIRELNEIGNLLWIRRFPGQKWNAETGKAL